MTTLIMWVLLATSLQGDQVGKAYQSKAECLETRQALIADARTAAVSDCIPVALTTIGRAS